MDPTAVGEDAKVLRIQLNEDSEVIVRVPLDEERNGAYVKLIPSTGVQELRVEVFGSPLHPDVRYNLLAGSVYTIFAWTAASIEVGGSPLLLHNVMRSSTRSLTRPIVEYHCLTQHRRSVAEKGRTLGPITLICGRKSLTKHIVARSLCSYAARAGWRPLFVDLDCGELQSVGIPGTIGASVIDFPTAVDDVISLTHLNITYFVGTTEPQKLAPNGETVMSTQYVNYASALMGTVRDRLVQHVGNIYAASGAIIVLPELHDNSAVNYIMDLTQQFGVTNILTIGDDYLFFKLLSRLSNVQSGPGSIQVDKMSQSHFLGGTLPPEEVLPLRFSNYFDGSGAVSLVPSRWLKRFEQLEVLQLKEEGDQVVCANVERASLQGVVGCIAALFKITKEGSPLNTTPIVYARVESVDAVGVMFLTTTHYTFPSEKLIAVVGSVRWITSAS